ncbi:MAG: ABC transporter permease [Limisphaerales bacterium]
MSFLPVAVRELQVAARRRSSFQLRFLAATGATILGGFFLLASALPGGLAASGRNLFHSLALIAWVLALVSGPLLTADCLSREKREGTLGFLFLTDLTGWEVVAGKFAANAVVPFQALLAVFPVLGMSVFLGGVTWGGIVAGLLAVLVTLFLSLSVGIWTSSRASDDRRAVWGSLLVMAALVALPYSMDSILEVSLGARARPEVRMLSPLALLESAIAGRATLGAGHFGFGGTLQCLAGLGFLGAAAWRVRAAWRVNPEDEARHDRGRGRRRGWVPSIWKRIVRSQEDRLRREGHLAWLGWRGTWVRSSSMWIWVVAAVVAVSLAGNVFGFRVGVATPGLWALKFMLAAHTVYFLNGLCRDGMMELLLVTPVSGSRMWRGHVAAVRAIFLWPFLALAVLEWGLGVRRGLAAVGDWSNPVDWLLSLVIPATFPVVVHGLDFVAIAYHSAGWAMRYDRPGKALFRTFFLVMLLPALLCSLGRVVVDLLVIARAAGALEGFRELAHRKLFPGAVLAPLPVQRVP